MNNDAVALHDDLVERSQRLACHGFGGVDPGEVTDTRHVVVDAHAQVLGRFRHAVIDIVRDEIVDNGLASRIVEMLAVDEEVAVGRTAPAPVEIEEVVVVIAVANECMTALSALSGIVKRNMLVDVRLQQSNPFVVGVARLGNMRGLVGIGEIGVDSYRHIRGESAAAIRLVHHIDRHAAMVHQGGDGHFLFLGRT